MSTMFNIILTLFAYKDFEPHGVHFIPDHLTLLWTLVAGNALIALSYALIPLALLYIVRKRKDILFTPIFFLFSGFILLCGLTHVIHILTYWYPMYYLQAIVYAMTGIISIFTFFALLYVIPMALKLRTPTELGVINDNLLKEIENRKKMEKELEAFSYSVSHDLRAPLRAINGFSTILTENYATNLDNEGKRIIAVIQSTVLQMGGLIDDLLSLSRLGQQEITIQAVDMNQLARNVYSELKAALPEREIEFHISELPIGYVDPSLFRQVWTNYLNNAIKFTRPRKVAKIEIGSRSEKNEMIYYIKDNGVGYDMKYQNKLFNAFQRLHSTEEFEGSGVGLAIVERIVSKHKGRVWSEGKVNQGATFYFALPVKK